MTAPTRVYQLQCKAGHSLTAKPGSNLELQCKEFAETHTDDELLTIATDKCPTCDYIAQEQAYLDSDFSPRMDDQSSHDEPYRPGQQPSKHGHIPFGAQEPYFSL